MLKSVKTMTITTRLGGVPGYSQFIQQAEQWLAVAVAQASLHLNLLNGIPWVLCMAQHTLNGALPQLPYQRLLQTRLDDHNSNNRCNKNLHLGAQVLHACVPISVSPGMSQLHISLVRGK